MRCHDAGVHVAVLLRYRGPRHERDRAVAGLERGQRRADRRASRPGARSSRARAARKPDRTARRLRTDGCSSRASKDRRAGVASSRTSIVDYVYVNVNLSASGLQSGRSLPARRVPGCPCGAAGERRLLQPPATFALDAVDLGQHRVDVLLLLQQPRACARPGSAGTSTAARARCGRPRRGRAARRSRPATGRGACRAGSA